MDSIARLFSERKELRIIVALIGFAFISVALYLIIISLAPHQKYEVTAINLSTQNANVTLSEGKLYSYSGGAFLVYELNSNSEPRVLLTGVKMPDIRNVTWANDKGAVVSVGDTWSMTGTIMEEYFDREGINWQNPNNDTVLSDILWYVDFGSGEARSFTPASSVNGGKLHYSNKDRGFYYISDENFDLNSDSLMFFSIETKESESVLSVDPFERIDYIGECINDSTLCIISAPSDKPNLSQLTSISLSNGDTNEYVSVSGVIKPTNNQNVFITSEDISSDGDASLMFDSLRLFNVSQDQHQKPIIEISDTSQIGSVILRLDETAAVSMFGNGGDYGSYISKAPTFIKTWNTKELSVNGADDYQISGVLSQSGESALMFDSGGNLILLAPEGTLKQTFERASAESVRSSLEQCKTKVSALYDFSVDSSEIRIFASATDDSFTKSFKQVGDCIGDNPGIFTGRSVRFSGVYAPTGRIILS